MLLGKRHLGLEKRASDPSSSLFGSLSRLVDTLERVEKIRSKSGGADSEGEDVGGHYEEESGDVNLFTCDNLKGLFRRSVR